MVRLKVKYSREFPFSNDRINHLGMLTFFTLKNDRHLSCSNNRNLLNNFIPKTTVKQHNHHNHPFFPSPLKILSFCVWFVQ